MAQSNVNREFVSLAVSHINVVINEGYARQSKLRTNSPLHGALVYPLQTIINNQSSKASASAAKRTGLFSPTNNNPNSKNFSQNEPLLLS